ncbi:MAG: protein-L-isoaspartate(D-aspartate) O-methyltransferase [Deltaproteobacteria bacterium]|jgi:protein-L-isoaspartate(D-aspartate) O-methyltransferase|nr:protein-L-isoaspartate(D-aspartate) O-methyltransferase [Deltaproteobacteria bacterium]
MSLENSSDYARPRRVMVEKQLMGRDIVSSEVLRIMTEIPRHLFVDEALVDRAYSDGPLPIGHGQTISQPYMVALMTQALELKPTNKVLEIGFGCGYQTAVLARLTSKVYAIERIPELFEKGKRNLINLKITNVSLKLGDGNLGWEEYAPFDAILVAAYGASVPMKLRDQLALGGRLVMPLGESLQQLLVLFTKIRQGKVTRQTIAACRFVPLVRNSHFNS